MRYASQLPGPVESLIIDTKREKPHWGARKIRELLVRRLAGDIRIPATSTMAWSSAGTADAARPLDNPFGAGPSPMS